MRYEYKEGQKASRNFEDAMKTIFKAPKTSTGKPPAKRASGGKKRKSDKG
jgi:hypothetical protein